MVASELVVPHLGARCLLLVYDVCKLHAVRGQDAAKAVYEDRVDAEVACDGRRVLPTRTAEAGQRVMLDVVALRLCEGAYGSTHGLVGHLDEAQRHLLHAHLLRLLLLRPVVVDAGCLSVEQSPAVGHLQTFVALLAKDAWEVLHHQATQHGIRVSNRQRATTPVAGRPRVGASRLGSDGKQAAPEGQYAATAGCHCVDVQLWCLYGDASGGVLERVLVVAVVA